MKKNKEEKREQAAQKQESRVEKPATERKKKRSYKEEKEYEQLAKDIEALENEKAELTAKMQEQLDYQELDRLGKRMNEITEKFYSTPLFCFVTNRSALLLPNQCGMTFRLDAYLHHLDAKEYDILRVK